MSEVLKEIKENQGLQERKVPQVRLGLLELLVFQDLQDRLVREEKKDYLDKEE